MASRRSDRGAVHWIMVLTLSASSQWVVLTKWMTWVVSPHQDAPHVGMSVESDAKHVKHLSLGPFGARPDIGDAIDHESRVFFDASGIQFRFKPDSDHQHAVIGVTSQYPGDAKSRRLGNGVVQIVRCGDMRTQVVVAGRIFTQKAHDLVEIFLVDNKRGAASKCGGQKCLVWEGIADTLQIRMYVGLAHGVGQAWYRPGYPTGAVDRGVDGLTVRPILAVVPV